jgi:DNA mismatch repair protein MutS2
MPGFDEHTLEVLEYNKVISILKGNCLTRHGMNLIDRLSPMTDTDAIATRLDEVSQMKDIIRFGEAFPLYRLEDVTTLLMRSKTEGIFLEPKDLLKIKELVEVSASLHNYAQSDRDSLTNRDRFPLIVENLAELHPYPEIKKEISKAIDRDGEILDSASQKLKKIRMDIGDLKIRITSRLQHILTGRQKSPGWQDDTVTLRDGRYVIPVVSGQFKADSGIIHDRSQSGATMYVEPNEIVEQNNKMGLLSQEERFEIDRILRHITSIIGRASSRLMANAEIIGILDSIHAAGLLSIKTEGNKPHLKDKSGFRLSSSRHPLLLYYTKDKDIIVPNDYALDDGTLAMIITGPNTGGKTVALKTVGLLILMAQSGLHIPTDENSEIGIFNKIFADIGDEQSIELSLSTFSSHVRQIIYAVQHADSNSLVLFDEIGAGTDPKEGAALAEAIILKLTALKAKLIVTTHYSQLKTLPMIHPEIENASFEFDRDSLRPTFRLLTGIPGASFAVEIAGRLGMPKDITTQAADLTGQGERSLSDLISSLEKELTVLRKDKTLLEEKLENAINLEKQYNSQIDKFKKEIDKVKKEHLQDLEDTLADARVQIEKLVKEIRESRASEKSIKDAQKFLNRKKSKVTRLEKKHFPAPVITEKFEPGDIVLIDSLQKEGEFVGYAGDKKGKIRTGNIMSVVSIADLHKITGAETENIQTVKNGNLRDMTAPGPEIHLRGMTVEEAQETLDKFLDSAILTGLRQIYVVHGKGTGILRKMVSEYLKKNKSVKSLRLGNWNEGGAGVTVVQLK